jgi:hypothetical protein
MRYAVLAVFMVALTASAAPAPAEKWAEKMFTKSGTTHDFGSVPRGALLHHRFTITNIYAVPLQVISTRTSCGCLTVSPPSGPIQPRESAAIDITVDTRRFTGPKTISVYITVGPQFVSTAVLQVSANSRADVVFNPGEVSFGVTQRGQTPTQVIDVEYAGGLFQSWKIKDVSLNGAPVDVTVKELYRRDPPPGTTAGQVGYRLEVKLKADAPAGTLKQDIFLQTTDPASPLVPVLVEATIQAPLSVVPSVVSLGSCKVGKEELRRVVVRGTKPFRILSIEGLGDGIDAEVPKTAAPVHIVTLKCQPAKPGEVRRQVLFKTDLEETPATVTVEGTAEP